MEPALARANRGACRARVAVGPIVFDRKDPITREPFADGDWETIPSPWSSTGTKTNTPRWRAFARDDAGGEGAAAPAPRSEKGGGEAGRRRDGCRIDTQLTQYQNRRVARRARAMAPKTTLPSLAHALSPSPPSLLSGSTWRTSRCARRRSSRTRGARAPAPPSTATATATATGPGTRDRACRRTGRNPRRPVAAVRELPVVPPAAATVAVVVAAGGDRRGGRRRRIPVVPAAARARRTRARGRRGERRGRRGAGTRRRAAS